MSVAPRDEPLQGQPGPGQHAADIDVDQSLCVGRVLVDEQTDRRDTGVVHQRVERTDALFGLSEERLELLRVADVERQPDSTLTEFGSDFDTCRAADDYGHSGSKT